MVDLKDFYGMIATKGSRRRVKVRLRVFVISISLSIQRSRTVQLLSFVCSTGAKGSQVI